VRRLPACVVALVLVACPATQACAHASLVSADPRDGSVLAQAPQRIELRFNESVTAGAVTLIDAQGRSRGDAKLEATADTIVMMLPSDLPQGSQIVSYRVISQDGHPVAGSVVFSIGAPSANAAPADRNVARDGLIWLARIGLYVGLFAGVGGAFFQCWIARATAARGPVLGALAVGVVAAAASLGLLGLDLLGLPLTGLADSGPWTVTLDTGFALSLAIAVAAMAAGWVAMQTKRRSSARALAALALGGVGLSLAVTGHAATASPEVLARSAIFVHGLGVAFWLGALVPLAILVRQSNGAAMPALVRFSAIAAPIVGVLALAGLALAMIELGRLRALIDTPYGIILSIKLALVVMLLGLAALNRYWLVPALAVEPRASGALGRSIRWEAATALAILAAVAGWRFTPPPRSLLPETPLALHIHHTDKAVFQVLISPGSVGSDDFVLQLMNGDGTPLPAKEVRLTLSLPGRGVEELEHTAVLEPDGYWHVREAALPLAGRWHMRIDALVSDFDEIALDDDFDITRR